MFQTSLKHGPDPVLRLSARLIRRLRGSLGRGGHSGHHRVRVPFGLPTESGIQAFLPFLSFLLQKEQKDQKRAEVGLHNYKGLRGRALGGPLRSDTLASLLTFAPARYAHLPAELSRWSYLSGSCRWHGGRVVRACVRGVPGGVQGCTRGCTGGEAYTQERPGGIEESLP